MPDSQPPDNQPPDGRSRRPPDPAGNPAGAEPGTLVLSGARLADGRTVDVRLGGGRIQAVGTAGSLTPDERVPGTRVELRGYLLLPAPAEPHAHSGAAFTADGPAEGAPHAGAHAPAALVEDAQRRTTEAALLQLGHGATALRTHVRVGDPQGLHALEGALQARHALRRLTDVQVVAQPRLLTGVAGADGRTVLRDAVKMGATAIGGCPDLDPDPAGHTEAVLRLAAEHGCPVDLHTDAADPARLTRLAAAVGGLRPGVALGPCGGLARLPYETAARAAEQLAAAGVTVVCLPQGDCAGVAHGVVPGAAPGAAPDVRADGHRCAPVRLLRTAGVRVVAGSGALRDAANPVGRGDPLEAAYLLASWGEAHPEHAYAAVSTDARTALGLPPVRVEAGFPGELLAVRGERIDSVLSLAYSRIVVHRGRVVARTSAVREYCDTAGAAELELPRQGPRG